MSPSTIVRRCCLLILAATMTGIGPAGAVDREVGEVTSGAYGFSASISIFRGAPVTAGPRPTVTLPPNGARSPITAAEKSDKAQVGPALIFQSKELKVSTKAITGPTGSSTSSAQITGDPKGPNTFVFKKVASTCNASAAKRAGSASFEGAVLATSTDKDGNPVDKEPVPNSPPPNYTRTGAVTHIGDKFKVVFNEQVEDGASITVNAVHEYLLGPAAVGEIIIGQSRCAIPPATPSASPAAQSSTESGSDAVPIVLGALGIALLAVIAVLTIRRSRTKREE